MQNLTLVRRPRDVIYHSITSTGCCYTFVHYLLERKEKNLRYALFVCARSVVTRGKYFWRVAAAVSRFFFKSFKKRFKIFYSAAKHVSLSFFLCFNSGLLWDTRLLFRGPQITRSVCHVFNLQDIKSLVYIKLFTNIGTIDISNYIFASKFSLHPFRQIEVDISVALFYKTRQAKQLINYGHY